MLSLRTRRGPSTASLKTPVKTVLPCHATSFGMPTLTDSSVLATAEQYRVRCQARLNAPPASTGTTSLESTSTAISTSSPNPSDTSSTPDAQPRTASRTDDVAS